MPDQRPAEKVTPEHLRRGAYLYVRQSTLRQVMENTTSTDRQYGLRQRAVASAAPAPAPSAATASSAWSPTSAWARPGS